LFHCSCPLLDLPSFPTRRSSDLLLQFNEILAKGFDGQHFIAGLASHFRDLLVCQNQETIALLEVGEQTKTRYAEQSQKTTKKFRSEEHTSELQSRFDIVCRLLLE